MRILNEMNPWYEDPILPQSVQREFAFALLLGLAGFAIALGAALYFLAVLVLGFI